MSNRNKGSWFATSFFAAAFCITTISLAIDVPAGLLFEIMRTSMKHEEGKFELLEITERRGAKQLDLDFALDVHDVGVVQIPKGQSEVTVRPKYKVEPKKLGELKISFSGGQEQSNWTMAPQPKGFEGYNPDPKERQIDVPRYHFPSIDPGTTKVAMTFANVQEMQLLLFGFRLDDTYFMYMKGDRPIFNSGITDNVIQMKFIVSKTLKGSGMAANEADELAGKVIEKANKKTSLDRFLYIANWDRSTLAGKMSGEELAERVLTGCERLVTFPYDGDLDVLQCGKLVVYFGVHVPIGKADVNSRRYVGQVFDRTTGDFKGEIIVRGANEAANEKKEMPRREIWKTVEFMLGDASNAAAK